MDPADSPSAADFEFHEAPTQPGRRRRRKALESPLVLVVEDDADSRAIFTQSLTHLGYRVCAARNGEQGVEMARRRRPSAILMDVSMPGIGGIEATRRIKADPRTRGCFVLVVTAHGATMFDEARSAGCDAYFCKPFNAFALDRVLRSLSAPPERSRAKVVKRCGCGQSYTRDRWLALPLCGRVHIPGASRTLELRNCPCGSSIGIAIGEG
jgi:CheY-like chemotaxis protein